MTGLTTLLWFCLPHDTSFWCGILLGFSGCVKLSRTPQTAPAQAVLRLPAASSAVPPMREELGQVGWGAYMHRGVLYPGATTATSWRWLTLFSKLSSAVASWLNNLPALSSFQTTGKNRPFPWKPFSSAFQHGPWDVPWPQALMSSLHTLANTSPGLWQIFWLHWVDTDELRQ